MSDISTKGPQMGEQGAIAKCCMLSAAMLRLADFDGHTKEKRAFFRQLNAAQAELLCEAAKRADELVAALEQLIDDMQDGHCVCEQAKQEAIAAISKATGKP